MLPAYCTVLDSSWLSPEMAWNGRGVRGKCWGINQFMKSEKQPPKEHEVLIYNPCHLQVFIVKRCLAGWAVLYLYIHLINVSTYFVDFIKHFVWYLCALSFLVSFYVFVQVQPEETYLWAGRQNWFHVCRLSTLQLMKMTRNWGWRWMNVLSGCCPRAAYLEFFYCWHVEIIFLEILLYPLFGTI